MGCADGAVRDVLHTGKRKMGGPCVGTGAAFLCVLLGGPCHPGAARPTSLAALFRELPPAPLLRGTATRQGGRGQGFLPHTAELQVAGGSGAPSVLSSAWQGVPYAGDYPPLPCNPPAPARDGLPTPNSSINQRKLFFGASYFRCFLGQVTVYWVGKGGGWQGWGGMSCCSIFCTL